MNAWNLAIAALQTAKHEPRVVLRKCTICGEAKSPDEYTGRYKQCKPCRSKITGKYNISDDRIIKYLSKRLTTGELSRYLKCTVTTLHSRLERMLSDGQITKEVVIDGGIKRAYWKRNGA
jgi:hypothetical protein